MNRSDLQKTILPFGLKEPPTVTSLPATRGFSNLTVLDTGEIEGEPTPSDPEKAPQKQRTQKELFQAAFAKARLSLDDMAPYRTRVVWRTTRYLAIKLGVMQPTMLLGDMPQEAGDPINGIDPWHRPIPPERLTPPHPDALTRQLMSLAHQCLAHADPVPFQRLHPTQDRIETVEAAGFTLLPTTQTAPYWSMSFDAICNALYVPRGAAKDKEQGNLGMMGLTDPERPDITVLACPSIAELLMWELFLIDEATKMLANTGEHLIDTAFREHYGLLPFETDAIISRARKAILERVSLDVEEQRALMVMRINDVMARAKEALDPRAELMALKLLSQTVGITRAEPEDLKSMFRKVVGEASKERRQLEYRESETRDA